MKESGAFLKRATAKGRDLPTVHQSRVFGTKGGKTAPSLILRRGRKPLTILEPTAAQVRPEALPPLRVLLVVAAEQIRARLSELIRASADLRLVSAPADAKAALNQDLQRLRPEVALVDADLSGISGSDCAWALKALCGKLRVLMLVSRTDEASVLLHLAAGASGWLPKDCEPEEILRALVDLARNGGLLRPEANAVAQRFFHAVSSPRGPLFGLSHREREVLFLHAGGQLHKEIADALSLAVKTVETHITSGYRKLGVRNRDELSALLLDSRQR